MRGVLRWVAMAALASALLSSLALAGDISTGQQDEAVRFSLPPLSDQERQRNRQSPPDAQAQLLAEVFPGAKPEISAGMAPLREDYSRPDGSGFLRVEGGAEVVDNRLGFRLGGGGSLYSADRRLGLRLDAAMVQGDAQRELFKLLLSAGAKLGEQNQMVFTAGWLNRYAWGNFSEVGDLGDNLNQYVLGLELERQLRQRQEGASPGVSASLSTLYFKSESKTLWSGFRGGENDSSYYRYFYEYGLAGGSQYEALAGVRLSWKPLSLELQGGFRHKEYEEYLGNAGRSDDAPKASARLTFDQVLGNEISAYYTWDPDLRVLGGGLRRPLGQGWSLVARAEMVQGEDRPDDTRYFLGLDYWFGGGKLKRALGQSSASEKVEKDRQAQEDRREAYARGDWLRPVRGSEVEYIQVMRQVQRKTRIWEIDKAGLPKGVTVNVNNGEIIISGLPAMTAVVLVTPSSAWSAFTIAGGSLKIIIEKLTAGLDHLAQIQQADGRYVMARVSTSRGSTIVNGVQYNSNLTECQVAAILANPDLINNPPDPAPTIGAIPDQIGSINTGFSSNLAAYVSGSGIKEYELTGALPAGLAFDVTTGLLYGKPTQQGVFYLGLRARNNCGWSAMAPLTLIINTSSGGGACYSNLAITTWTPSFFTPNPGDISFNVVDFVTNAPMSAGSITATITTDAPGETVSATVVNDDGGAGYSWHVNGNFTNINFAGFYTVTVTVRDACGNTASRSYNNSFNNH